MKINDFIGQLFLARDIAHSVHLSTDSYAKHAALNVFYDEIIDLADKFAEAYQGRHGIIGAVNFQFPKRQADVNEFLKDSLEEIEASRFDVAGKTDTALQNIIDEIVGLYLSTIYKLEHLK